MADQNIIGGRELAELLGTLPAKVEQNIMRAALRAGAAVFREEVKEKIPVVRGKLRRTVKVSVKAKRGQVLASLKVGGKNAWYAHLVEYGTRPHKITPKRAKALRIAGYTVADVDHPGSRPHPFIRPAFDAKSSAAIAAVAAKIRERLTLAGLNAPATLEII